MEREIITPIEHYPFQGDTKPHVVRQALWRQIRSLVKEMPVEESMEQDISQYLLQHILLAESLFSFEEKAREMGEKFANLYYHGKEHAVYQTTHDAIYILRSIIKRQDLLTTHLSQEGILATVIAAAYHDTGYVDCQKLPCNFAARTPVHIQEGIKTATNALDKIDAPVELDLEKMKKYISLAIYSTSFPYTPEHKKYVQAELAQMNPEQRKEAQIVRLSVQLADLGGQTARIDYTTRLVLRLREEMNCVAPFLGTQVIGENREIGKKSVGFVKMVVKPQVGRIANALLGTKDHDFAREWEHLIQITSLIS